MPFSRGDFVKLESEGQSIEGMIALASGNGRSLAIMINGIFRGHIGVIPLLQGEDGVYRSIVTDRTVAVETISRPE